MPKWILITDAVRARIFSADPRYGTLQLQQVLKHPLSRAHDHEIAGDEPGRMLNVAGRADRSAMDPRSNPHAVEVRQFARELADALRAGYDRRAYDGLAIVAAPHFLGILRHALGPHLRRRLQACVPRNCTRVARKNLAKSLGDALSGWFGP